MNEQSLTPDTPAFPAPLPSLGEIDAILKRVAAEARKRGEEERRAQRRRGCDCLHCLVLD